MKTLLRIGAGVCFLAAAGIASATDNLVLNGDFEAAAISPWVATGVTVTSSGLGHSASVGINGSLSQTFATKPGAKYYVAGSATISGFTASLSMTAAAVVGGAIDGSKTITVSTIPGVPGLPGTTSTASRPAFYFTASSSSTKLTVTFTDVPVGIPSSAVLDDVVVYELTPSKLAGKYSGTLSQTLDLDTDKLKQSVTTRLVARILGDGSVRILRDATEIYTGIIFNDGTFDLSLGTLGRSVGTATVRGKHVEITIDGAITSAVDEVGLQISNSVTTKLILNRTGS